MTHHAGSDEGLSEAEQRALLRHIRLPDGNCTCDGMSRQLPHLIATVERILTARAAAPDALRERVEALHRRRRHTANGGTALGTFDFVGHGQTDFPDLCDHCRAPWPCATIRAFAERPTDGAGT